MQRFDHREYVSMTMEFRCNLRCVHCMIEDTMHRLAPESAGRFEELFAETYGIGAVKGTDSDRLGDYLRRDLPDLAPRASGRFRTRSIQTHGMHWLGGSLLRLTD